MDPKFPVIQKPLKNGWPSSHRELLNSVAQCYSEFSRAPWDIAHENLEKILRTPGEQSDLFIGSRRYF